VDAKNTMVALRVTWRQRKTKVDKLAAQTILQAYLDEQRSTNMKARHATDE